MDRLHELESLAQGLLESLGLKLTATATADQDNDRLELDGADAWLMVEKKGAALDAFQLIVAKVAERKYGPERRVMVDCQGHRRGRDQEIEKIARAAAEKVRSTARPLELDPMNPYERRLVHLALSDFSGVATSSVGEGFIKRVRISPTQSS
jgi:spoIIIJ-associated protein